MKLQPLIPIWLLVIYLGASAGFVGWYYWKFIRKSKQQTQIPPNKLLRRAAILLLPGIIAMGPSVQGGVSSPGVTNLDVVFAVDTTPSMGAQDYRNAEQRLDGAKKDMMTISEKLKGAHMEIITFNTHANLVLPLTTDMTAFSSAVDGLEPQLSDYSEGSSVDEPISLIEQELKASENAFPDHYRLLFYLGDGEQTAESAVKSFASLADYLTGGAVLGYGTTKGAQMVKYTGPNNAPSYISTVDPATNKLVPAISKTDPAALQKIATQLKVSYVNGNELEISYIDGNQGLDGALDFDYEQIGAKLAVDKSQRVIHYLNLYWLVAVPFAGLLFWEWQSLVLKLIDLRELHKKALATSPKTKRGGNRA